MQHNQDVVVWFYQVGLHGDTGCLSLLLMGQAPCQHIRCYVTTCMWLAPTYSCESLCPPICTCAMVVICFSGLPLEHPLNILVAFYGMDEHWIWHTAFLQVENLCLLLQQREVWRLPCLG